MEKECVVENLGVLLEKEKVRQSAHWHINKVNEAV
jgi:hypothetical protein